MRILRILFLMVLFSVLTAAANPGTLLKAHYRQVEGTDPSYGQGAIERNELAHREVEPFLWLILVDDGDTDDWRRRLDAVTDPKHGSWSVTKASPEEVEAVRSGKIKLQK